MSDPNKTVFISYRRHVSAFIARAIFMDLQFNGYDVFMDVESIDNGPFDTILLNQIAARTHFIVILTPGAIERCIESNDWLRREIELAMDLQRNLVPLLVNNFSFAGTEAYLTGKLSQLQRYNAVPIPHEYFDEAMSRLRTRYLKQPAYPVTITPTTTSEHETVQQKITEASSQPAPTDQQLSAEQHYDRSWTKWEAEDWNGVIADCSEAVRLNPQFASAYMRRSGAKINLGDNEGAIEDATIAIRLVPADSKAFYNRAKAQQNLHDFGNALSDYNEAIRLNSHYILGFDNRAGLYYDMGNYDAAIADWSEAISLKPDDASTYSNRGEAFLAKGDSTQALADFSVALRLNPDSKYSLAGLAITYHALGQLDKAKQSWQRLVTQNHNYENADWVKTELNWAEPLVEEARRLIAKL